MISWVWPVRERRPKGDVMDLGLSNRENVVLFIEMNTGRGMGFC